jgi:DNA repair photolyase
MHEEETTKVAQMGRRGRGSLSNASGRFEAEARSSVDDGWGTAARAPAPLCTTLTEDQSRSIIARNTSPDIGFDRSINPYRGCEHGCVYCFARPTHAWLGLSAGLDFESRLFYKPAAARLLEKELGRPHYRPAPIAMGTNTDPYQPVEQRLEITRAILQVLARFEHPVAITTKSQSIVRDIDILAPMAARGLVKVALSVTTLDRGLARRMEPRAATPGRRLAALRQLGRAGIPTAVMVAPVIPAINDGEIEAILEAAAEAGAAGAGYILLRLPLEIRQLWVEWLAEHYPDRAGKVMGLMRGMRGGRDYDPTFGRRMTGQGAYARLIGRRFRLAAKRLGLATEGPPLDCSRFRPPPRPGEQLKLL